MVSASLMTSWQMFFSTLQNSISTQTLHIQTQTHATQTPDIHSENLAIHSQLNDTSNQSHYVLNQVSHQAKDILDHSLGVENLSSSTQSCNSPRINSPTDIAHVVTQTIDNNTETILPISQSHDVSFEPHSNSFPSSHSQSSNVSLSNEESTALHSPPANGQVETETPIHIEDKGTQTSQSYCYRVGPHLKSHIPRPVVVVQNKRTPPKLVGDRSADAARRERLSSTAPPALRTSSSFKESSILKRSTSQNDARCIKKMILGRGSKMSTVGCSLSTSPDRTKLKTSDTSPSMKKAASVSALHWQDFNSTDVTWPKKVALSTNSGNRLSLHPPKWRPAGPTPVDPPPIVSSGCKADGSGCVPKASDLRITRAVGKDGVVIAWNPLDHGCIAGFQVIVEGKVVQTMRSPQRTKSLIPSLPEGSPVTIGLISVGVDGRCSKPAVVTYHPTSRNCKKLSPKRTAVPTAI